MNIPSRQVIVYEWFDIERAICEAMGIAQNQFRDYHKVIGGDYKDCWHVCLETIVPDHMANGVTVTMWYYDADNEFTGEHAWKNQVIQAWNTVYTRLGQADTGIEVHFGW